MGIYSTYLYSNGEKTKIIFQLHVTVKFIKFWDARNLCCDLPKIQTKRPNIKGILSKWCKWNSKQWRP